MIHALDPRTYNSFFSTIDILRAIIDIHGEQFTWKPPPYEYEYEKMPIDIILGDSTLRREIETGEDITKTRNDWDKKLKDYLQWRESFLLYP